MYARLVTFRVAPGHRHEMESLARESHAYMQFARGFHRAQFMLDEPVHEYASLSIWDTKEDVEHASAVLKALLHDTLHGIAEGPPAIHTYEVFDAA